MSSAIKVIEVSGKRENWQSERNVCDTGDLSWGLSVEGLGVLCRVWNGWDGCHV